MNEIGVNLVWYGVGEWVGCGNNIDNNNDNGENNKGDWVEL